MSEQLIRELVRFKLHMAGTVLSHMPAGVTGKINSTGRIILETLNEYTKDTKRSNGSKERGVISNIPVE